MIVSVSSSQGRMSSISLLLAGVTINSMCGAAILFVSNLTGVLKSFAVTRWLMGGAAPASREQLQASAPKKGPFRLMPAVSVAEAAWQAYHSNRLHWYVPKSIRLIDFFKGLSPEFVRRSIVKSLPALMPKRKEVS